MSTNSLLGGISVPPGLEDTLRFYGLTYRDKERYVMEIIRPIEIHLTETEAGDGLGSLDRSSDKLPRDE